MTSLDQRLIAVVVLDMAESTHPSLSGYGKLADEVERVFRSIYRDATL